MHDLTLVLPFPPTINSYYGRTSRGVVYIRKAGRAFRLSAMEVIQMQACGICLDYPLHLEVVLYPPDKRKRDLDNYMKPLLDSLTHAGLIEDDSLIDQLSILRGIPQPSGCCVVTLNEAGPVMLRNF